MARSQWTGLNDADLLAQCAVDTYRASGPGGQKRNKTSSAVRLRHEPSGFVVIAEESRSQHENKARALKRLRRRFFLAWRETFPPSGWEGLRDDLSRHQLKLGVKDERFWPMVGLTLDAMEAHQGRVSEAASALGVSTGRMVDFLATDTKVWEETNHLRQRHGHKLLKVS